jgi:hypothetical protein
VRFVTTRIASRLTGLSTEKLREWTSRRALVPADVRPKRKGSPAKFTWQTILVLRIAVLLRGAFNLELEAHKESFANLRTELRTKSFLALWGQRLALRSDSTWSLLEESVPALDEDVLLIQLDPHLRVLRDGFSLPDAAARQQLDFFSLEGLDRVSREFHTPRPPRRRRLG